MYMGIVPSRASDIFGVNNIDDSDPWVEQTTKISDAHKEDWDCDSQMYSQNWPLQLRYNGSDKWQLGH